jgi:hypothetical protein
MIVDLVVPERGWPATATGLGRSRMARSKALWAVASLGCRRRHRSQGKMDAWLH